jgi:hypothetical protein
MAHGLTQIYTDEIKNLLKKAVFIRGIRELFEAAKSQVVFNSKLSTSVDRINRIVRIFYS